MSPNRPDSRNHAAQQKALAEKYKADAEKLGAKYGVPPAMVLGIMSKESDFGTTLDANGRGDNGHGFGIMQVDDRSHDAVGGPRSYEHMDQAMGIFDSSRKQVAAAHPDWTESQVLAGSLVAYNSGPGNVGTQPSDAAGWASMDRGTTGNDYSRDTWARSQWFADNLW
jgi:soluble lytic murein transglycosylase-like protein